MQIHLTKNNGRNLLQCVREDHSITKFNLGPDLPYHDLAHFIVESHFKLGQGFFGLIASGKSIEQLNDREVIIRLGSEIWLAEVLTRNLQATFSGSSSANEFIELVKWEAESSNRFEVPSITSEDVRIMMNDYKLLIERWQKTPVNKSLILEFSI